MRSTVILAALGAAAFAACSAPPAPPAASAGDVTIATTASDSTAAPSSPPDTVPIISVELIEPSPRRVGVSALRTVPLGVESPELPEPAVPLGHIRSGGPPPDGIPAIDRPTFLRAGDVDFLADNEPVLAFDLHGEARAYPVQILIWHEIANDTVGGLPVAITYCPLCNTAIAYDRQTESLWSHFTAAAVAGELTGRELDTLPVATVPWSVWRDNHPDGLVLSRETGFDRDYGRNPYPGYDDLTATPFLFEGTVDGRYTAMTRVVGAGNCLRARCTADRRRRGDRRDRRVPTDRRCAAADVPRRLGWHRR